MKNAAVSSMKYLLPRRRSYDIPRNPKPMAYILPRMCGTALRKDILFQKQSEKN